MAVSNMKPIIIKVISTGGTIASNSSAGSQGVTPQITGEELVAQIGELPENIEVVAESFALKSSGDITFQALLLLAEHVNDAVNNNISGVVFTQGTDTIEETSFALSLLTKGTTPFVVTGAMRNPGLLGADGTSNLRDAIMTVAKMIN